MTIFLKRFSILFVLLFFFQVSNVFASESTEYILIFDEEIDYELLHSLESIDVVEEFTFFPGVVIVTDDRSVETIRSWPTVSSIEENQELIVESSTYANWGISHLAIPSSWNLGYTGKGVKVAVVDSGIAPHPALTIRGGVSMVDYTTSYFDDNGHGTHSAGIIAANQASSHHLGVAYDVDLYSVKTLDSSGNGRLNDTIRGIEWAIKENMDIINLSLGTSTPSSALKSVVDYAYEQGIIVVAAAGNKSKNTATPMPVEYPAKYGSVVAVSAVDNRNRIASFSATGPEIEFSAPGVSISSTYLNNRFASLSGTSMATPFVAGVFALYREAYPHLNGKEIRKLAQRDAFPLTSSRDERYGYGLIQPPTKIELSVPRSLRGTTISTNSDDSALYSLQWSHQQADRVAAYQVYRNGQLIATVRDLYFEETLIPGDYVYTLTAVSKDGTESKKSSSLSVLIPKTEVEPEPVPEPSEPEPEPKPEPTPEELIHFSDVGESFWAGPHISYLASNRIVSGYADGSFKPSAPVRRGQAVAMIARALNWDTTQMETNFSDVDKEYFASGDIAHAIELGIISGFPDGTFKPNAPITRAQMAAILGKAFSLGTDSTIVFEDVTTSTTGYREINQLAKLGIVTGYDDGRFYQPSQTLTRAQFSVILSRVLNVDLRD